MVVLVVVCEVCVCETSHQRVEAVEQSSAATLPAPRTCGWLANSWTLRCGVDDPEACSGPGWARTCSCSVTVVCSCICHASPCSSASRRRSAEAGTRRHTRISTEFAHKGRSVVDYARNGCVSCSLLHALNLTDVDELLQPMPTAVGSQWTPQPLILSTSGSMSRQNSSGSQKRDSAIGLGGLVHRISQKRQARPLSESGTMAPVYRLVSSPPSRFITHDIILYRYDLCRLRCAALAKIPRPCRKQRPSYSFLSACNAHSQSNTLWVGSIRARLPSPP